MNRKQKLKELEDARKAKEQEELEAKIAKEKEKHRTAKFQKEFFDKMSKQYTTSNVQSRKPQAYEKALARLRTKPAWCPSGAFAPKARVRKDAVKAAKAARDASPKPK